MSDPLQSLCTADWERLEAIMIVLGHNLRLFSQNTHGMLEPLWAVPWMGASPDSFAPLTISMLKGQPAPPPNALDVSTFADSASF